MKQMSQTILITLTAALALAGVAALPAAAGSVSEACVSAIVDEAILLPTGEEHPSGRLTVCVTRHFTPVTTLHKTYVDGRMVGLLQSRRGYSEGTTGQPYMMFQRDGQGRLNLYGFATPAGSRMATYHLGSQPRGTGSSTMARGAAAGAGTLVMMAKTGPANAH